MRTLIAILAAVVVLETLSSPTSAKDPASFKIRVAASADGVEMSCSAGCAWKTLAFSCDRDGPCSADIDENGMTKE